MFHGENHQCWQQMSAWKFACGPTIVFAEAQSAPFLF